MAYATKYQLDYRTKKGSDVEWRLDIEQEGYSGTITNLIAGDEPVVIKYDGKQDIYEPIITSKAEITLIEDGNLNLDDFTALLDDDDNFDARAYRVTLRYKETGDSSYSTYWRGFITNTSSRVDNTRNPRQLKITAIDGIGLIADVKLAPFTDTDPDDQTRVGEYIFHALHETGAQLDVRVYSDLRTTINGTSEYAIVDTEVSDWIYFDKYYAPTKTVREAMEDVLKSFNAVVFQSKGVWCVRSASNHIGTISGSSEPIPFKTYTYNSNTETWDNGTETTNEGVVHNFPNSIVPVERSHSYEDRRPYFSVERSVTQQHGLPASTNSFFTSAPSSVDDTEGPVWRNRGLGKKVDGDAKNYGTTRTAHSANEPDARGTHYLSTGRTNNSDGSDRRDLWFESNISINDIYDWEKIATIVTRQTWTDTNIAKCSIGVSLVFEIQDGSRTDYYAFNFEDNEWDFREKNTRTAWNRYWTEIETTPDNSGAWISTQIGDTLEKGRSTSGVARLIRNGIRNLSWAHLVEYLPVALGPVGVVAKVIRAQKLAKTIQETLEGDNASGTFKIRIGDVKAWDSNGKRLSPSIGTVTTDVDAVVLEYATEEQQPFFERYQSTDGGRVETYSDSVGIISEGPNIYRGSLSEDDFFRNGKSETLSLEKIVTQQRLNDYRNPLRFYYGTYIPKPSEGVVHLIDKIRQNFTGEADTQSSIQHYFSLNTRGNEYSITAYRTNQSTDVSSTFGEEDVYPSQESYSWRETIINYDIELDLSDVVLPSTGGIETMLNGAIAEDAATITVDSTQGFPTSGWILIGTNEIHYTGRSSTTFTGCTGANAHADNATVKAGVGSYIDTGLTPYLDVDDNPEYGKYFFRYNNVAPDEPIRQIINLQPISSNYEINGSNFSVDNASDIEAENIDIIDVGVGVRLSMDLETNDYSEEVSIVLGGEIDVLSEDNVNFDVSASAASGSSGFSVSSVTEQNIPVSQQEFISVYVTPDSTSNQITKANSSVDVTPNDSDGNEITGESIVGTIQELSYGDGIHYIIPVTPTADLDDLVIVVTATVTAKPAGDVETSELTFNSVEAGDSTDFSINNPPTVDWTVGSRFSVRYEVEADANKYFDTDGITVTINDNDSDTDGVQSDITNTYVIFGSHREYFVVVEGTTPAADSTNSITINAQLIDNPPLNSSIVTFNKGDDPSGVTVTKPENQTGLWGVTEAVLYYLAPTNGAQQISTTPTATVTDANNVTGTGSFTRSGTGWIYTLPFTYPTVDRTVSVTFGNATTTNINTDTNTQLDTNTITVTAAKGTGSNFIISDTSLTTTGVEGTTSEVILQVEATGANNLSTVSLTSTEETLLGTTRTRKVSEKEWLVFIKVTHPSGSSNASAAVTVNATTVAETATVFTHTVSFEDDDANTKDFVWTQGDGNQTYDLVPGSETVVTYQIEPDSGKVLPSDFTITSSQTWAVVGSPVYYYNTVDEITLAEIPVTITGQSSASSFTLSTSGTIEDASNTALLRINIDSTDAFNANVTPTFFEIPFTPGGSADTTNRTFTIQSADATMEYTNVSNVSITADTGVTVDTLVQADDFDSGVITATISSVSFPSTYPSGGLVEKNISISGNATSGSTPTSGGSSLSIVGTKGTSATNQMNVNGDSIPIQVTADGEWELSFSTSASVLNQGASSTYTYTTDPVRGIGNQVVTMRWDTTKLIETANVSIYCHLTSIGGSTSLANVQIFGGGGAKATSNPQSTNIRQIELVTTIPAADDQVTGTLYIKAE